MSAVPPSRRGTAWSNWIEFLWTSAPQTAQRAPVGSAAAKNAAVFALLLKPAPSALGTKSVGRANVTNPEINVSGEICLDGRGVFPLFQPIKDTSIIFAQSGDMPLAAA